MTITAKTVIREKDFNKFTDAIAAGIDAGQQPIGASWQDKDGNYIQDMIEGAASATFEDLNDRVTALESADTTDESAIADLDGRLTTAEGTLATAVTTNGTQATSITNLNTWANVLATKLNADATVTDNDYDTNPQA